MKDKHLAYLFPNLNFKGPLKTIYKNILIYHLVTWIYGKWAKFE